jgi:rhamnosyltransferase
LHIFIIGSKGIPANYGGFETFVEKLTTWRQDSRIHYHVSCMADEDSEFDFKGVHCFQIKTPKIGSAAPVIYDLRSLQESLRYIEKHGLKNCIIYICACRIGPFLLFYKDKLRQRNIKLLVNPDGHEWLRSKWNILIKQYWKISERLCVKTADHVVCDSKAIEDYIHTRYAAYNKATAFIPYGAIISPQRQWPARAFIEWKKRHRISDSYYLIVGRFVPENNYEVMLREFIASNSNRDLVIVTNVEKNKFYRKLDASTAFSTCPRIKFVGTVYDEELLTAIRQNAFAYLHGHEVGGTNPSLLEAMANTPLNILLDVVFNREVAGDSALFFSKKPGSLSNLLKQVEQLPPRQISWLTTAAKTRIRGIYSWELVVKEYEAFFAAVIDSTPAATHEHPASG